jgi:hypothetical protein
MGASGKELTTPVIVMRSMAPLKSSVNQIAPSGPVVMPRASPPSPRVAIGKFVKVCAGASSEKPSAIAAIAENSKPWTMPNVILPPRDA